MGMKKITYVPAERFIVEAVSKLNPANIILDVGCGIRPQSYGRTFIHICIDAHTQYLNVLKKSIRKRSQLKGRMKYLFLNKTTEQIVDHFPEKIVDSIFLLDVIEHLDKKHGIELIQAFDKISRHQIVIFTPFGFVEQEHPDGKDAWGLDGGRWQQHRSGWTPDDFDESWEFIVCENFHEADNKGEKHAEPVGAFFAIKTKGTPPESIFTKTLFSKILFWLKSFKLYNQLKRV